MAAVAASGLAMELFYCYCKDCGSTWKTTCRRNCQIVGNCRSEKLEVKEVFVKFLGTSLVTANALLLHMDDIIA